MATNDPTPYTPPPVQNRSARPPGILPKNAQGWVIAGIALVMVIVIALTGNNPPKGRAPSPVAAAGVVDPNDARIQDYRVRIEAQAQKLAAEQARFLQSRQALGLANSARPRLPSAAAEYAEPFAGPTPYAASGAGQNWIEIDEAKRAYQSRYASNIALSYRTAPVPSNPAPSASPDDARVKTASDLASIMAALRVSPTGASSAPPVPMTEAGKPATGASAAEDAGAPESRERPRRYPDLNHSTGKTYRLFEGAVIETVLTNRLDGSFSGPVNCMVTTAVYSHDRLKLLIPQGSRVIGEARKVQTFNQQRLAVVFHRLIMPDGYSVSLDKLQGLSQIGETGLLDQVNHHYLQIFGVSLAIGAIAGFSQANTQAGLSATGADAYRQGAAASLSQSSLNILDRYLNVLPTFTIREGQRVKIYLTEDFVLPAYDHHAMPADL